MGLFFPKEFFFLGGALGLGLTCLGLEPALLLDTYLRRNILRANHHSCILFLIDAQTNSCILIDSAQVRIPLIHITKHEHLGVLLHICVVSENSICFWRFHSNNHSWNLRFVLKHKSLFRPPNKIMARLLLL